MGRNVNPRPQLLDSAGDPLISGKMYYFESGTDTPKATFADVNMTIQNTHPVILTGDGRLPNVFLSGTARMKLTDADDVQIWDIDPTGGEDIGGDFEEWVPSVVYNTNDIVQGSDGAFYISFTNGNLGNDPTSTPTEWQEIQFINIWNTNVTYQIGDTVKGSDNLFYVSQTADNQGNDPTSDAVNWGPPFDGVVSITGGTGITVSGTSSIPIVTADNNGTVTSVSGGTGITVGGTAADPIINADNNGTVTSVSGGTGITISGTASDPIVNNDFPELLSDTTPQLGGFLDANGKYIGRDVGAAIPSASPLVLGTDGDHFSITGTTGFSAFTVAAGRHFTCTFAGILTITVGAGITINNDGEDYTTAPGDIFVGQSTASNVVTGYFIKADGSALAPQVLSTGFITGLETANNTIVDTLHDIDITAGAARDASDTEDMVLASALGKQLDVAWAVGGTPAAPLGGLDTGSIAADSWYYVWLIKRTDTGVVDVLFSLSSTAPTMPADYDTKRLIWAVKTKVAATEIELYKQIGNSLEWGTDQQDFNGTGSTGGALLTVKAPVLPVTANAAIYINKSTTVFAIVQSPDKTAVVPSVSNLDIMATGGADRTTINKPILTDTGQIYHRVNIAATTFQIIIKGFILDRSII
ncbi:MAG: hypothetical protein KAI73_05070 [Rhodospirillaceae bacterium]|nr:hypothetical protein [Rhodospirillaceae bacterium]